METDTVECKDFILNEVNNLKDNKSTTNFKKFIYDLFEKNGVLNDLRAYLRGHIVDVLKSAQTGEPPTCQKHFTKCLELPHQAMNMLITEYLLRMEFSYSLSVFISEIPLSNMVFELAKSLMQSSNGDFETLKFKDSDVWSILYYLGLKCDSNYATNILCMYKKENLPLLTCILKCTPMYQGLPHCIKGENVSTDSLASSTKSVDSSEAGKAENIKSNSKGFPANTKCHHYKVCNSCQAKMSELREKYKTKKSHLQKISKSMDNHEINLKTVMRNVSDAEEGLVADMFQELKSVYEAEVDMVKQDDERKVKRSLASHALQLQRTRDEMEESFKTREAELERNIQEKKKFLWGLARGLREKHASMARAMDAVRHEAELLSAKEDNLKTQLLNAEDVLRKRGEEMRKQITDELNVLEGYLESMKVERDCLNKERSELEQLKAACVNNNLEPKDHGPYYDSLKDELIILKKYLESSKLEPKRVVERSTLTDISDVTSKITLVLNNKQDADRIPIKTDSGERLTSNKVVNDLKKQKNVNFCTSNVDELYHESSCERSRSRSTVSSEDIHTRDQACDRELDRLRDENERLREFARQQRSHIDRLSSPLAQPRPHTAPARGTILTRALPRLNMSISSASVGWRKGAGEELSLFGNAPPRVYLPGDTVPFVGTISDRHCDNRRYLINQWRSLRRRMSPVGVTKPRGVPSGHREKSHIERTMTSSAANPGCSSQDNTHTLTEKFTFQPYTRTERPKISMVKPHGTRDKSPKTVLIEAKEKLKNNTIPRDHHPSRSKREKSPSSVLKEAKMRLRKLEIEAEAVERSYLDFRRRQSEIRQERVSSYREEDGQKDMKQNLSSRERSPEHAPILPFPDPRDINRYTTEYPTKLTTTFQFKNSTYKHKDPIPSTFVSLDSETKDSQGNRNFVLDTPLTEFRKLYQFQRDAGPEKLLEVSQNVETKPVLDDEESRLHESTESKSKSLRRQTEVKKEEIAILKSDITKIYNLENDNTIDENFDPIQPDIDDIESLKDENNTSKIIIKPDDCEDELKPHRELQVVVDSTVDTREIDLSEPEMAYEQISTQMTILVSPKRSSPNDKGSKSLECERSVSPELAAKLTRNDALNAIFHTDACKIQSSSIDMDLNVSKDDLDEALSDEEKVEDYPDDFSVDIDNYRSDNEPHSPMSLPNNSEEDNFWN